MIHWWVCCECYQLLRLCTWLNPPHSKMKRERALRWSSASQLPYWKTWPHELRWEREADCVFKQFSTDVHNICVWPAIQIHKISFYISLLQNWLIINFSEVLLNVCQLDCGPFFCNSGAPSFVLCRFSSCIISECSAVSIWHCTVKVFTYPSN